MTNKSIRDYINLIEDAQREGVAEGSKEKGMAAYRKGAHDAHNDKEETNPYPSGTYDYNSYKSGYRTGLAHKDKQQGVAEAVWDRPSQSYVPRDGRTFGQTNHPREEHCDACGAATGHAGPGEDSNVDDEGNVYCDDCYADQKGVAEGSGEYCDACDRVITKKPHVCPGTHGVSEEQLEETSPEAIAKINQITRK